jgi:multidrug resistance protein
MEELKKEVPAIKINEGLLLFILAAINFTHIMDFVIMAPLGPILKEEFHIETKESSFLIAVYALSACLSSFIGTFFIDRFDRKKALMFLYLGFIISNLSCALSNSYHFLAISRIIAGGFGGIIGALVLAMVADAFPYERRGKATGIVMSAFSFASIIGIPIGLYLAANVTWQAPFVMLTVLSSAILLAAFFALPSMKGHMRSFPLENNPDKSFLQNKLKKAYDLLASILGNPNLRWSLFFMVMVMLAGLTIVPFLSDYTVFNIGLDKKTELPLIYLFGGLATVITNPVIGKLSDKYGKQKMFMISAFLSLAPILVITNMGHHSVWVVLPVSVLFFIFFGGRFVPAMSMVTSSVDPKQRGSFMSINSSLMQLASFTATYGAGLVIQNSPSGELINFNYVGIFACAATLACVAISYRVKKVS